MGGFNFDAENVFSFSQKCTEAVSATITTNVDLDITENRELKIPFNQVSATMIVADI